MHKHHSALGLATTLSTATRGFEIAKHGPVQPVTLIRPHAASRAARFFVEKFPGKFVILSGREYDCGNGLQTISIQK